MVADRRRVDAQVGAGKEQAKSADEARRAKVTAVLQKVFDATKADVEAILSGLDGMATEKFVAGEKAARDAFTAEHRRRMDTYKDKRYSGLAGKARWAKDKFAGLPAEANQIFVVARRGYVERMRQVISAVAEVIGVELGRAKQRIAAGRNQLQAEVNRLPADLRAIGRQAAGEFAGRLDELTEQVDSKGTELVQALASKYTEALTSVNEEIEAEKQKNRGLVATAVAAIGGVITTITQLKDLLTGVLARAAGAVTAILKDPVGFLANLVSAVGAGLRQFLANIGEHLKKGLAGWLTGAMAGAGLELPARFDLRGIVTVVGSLLGLTWPAVRGRIVHRGVPEPAMGAVEQSVPLVQKVRTQGLGGIWEEIRDKVGDVKTTLFAKISEYLIPTVLMAGITWILSLLNPASAFVRAAKMIVDFVTFIITQGAQIIEFVNAVLDAVITIATGGIPGLIEKALARSVPVLIGALAAVLGIGGIAQKVKTFFKALSRPVTRAVDWVVGKIVGLGKKLWAKLRRPFDLRRGRRRPDRAESLRQARHELPGRYASLLRTGPSESWVRSRSEQWRQQYHLNEISLNVSGGRAIVVARVTPFQVAQAVITANESAALNRMVREVAMNIINDPTVVRQVFLIMEDRRQGHGRTAGEPRVTESPAAEAAAIMWETRKPSWRTPEYLKVGSHPVAEKQTGWRPGNIHTDFSDTFFGGRGNYPAIMSSLASLKKVTRATDAEVMQAIRAVAEGGQPPATIASNPDATEVERSALGRGWFGVSP